MALEPRYEEPFHWWGSGWEPAAPLSLIDLLRNGAIDPEAAALLWAGLSRHESIVIIGGPGGIGKSTLLGALLQLAPQASRLIHLRGCYETFAFLDDVSLDPTHTVLVANEISPHLPVYLWGGAVERALNSVRQGFALLATAHASSVAEFVATLTGSPLRLPTKCVASFDLVVLLEAHSTGASGRRVTGIWRLEEAARGIAVERIWEIAESDKSQEATFKLATSSPRQPPFPELEMRASLLSDLRDGMREQLPGDEEVRNFVGGSLRNEASGAGWRGDP